MATRDRDQDLSRLAEDSMTGASMMLAGGTGGPRDAMTAPGSESAEPLDGDQAAPRVRAHQSSYRRLITGGQRGQGAHPAGTASPGRASGPRAKTPHRNGH